MPGLLSSSLGTGTLSLLPHPIYQSKSQAQRRIEEGFPEGTVKCMDTGGCEELEDLRH